MVICSCGSSQCREYALGFEYTACGRATAASPRRPSWYLCLGLVVIAHASGHAMRRALVAGVPMWTNQVLRGGSDIRCI